MERRSEELDALLDELQALANDDELQASGPAGRELLQVVGMILRAVNALL